MSTGEALSPETEAFRIDEEIREIFHDLARPIENDRVRWRWGDAKKSFKLHYITARTLMNRLDEVLGPENWWDDYTPGENSVLCRLSIRLPGGRILTKMDAGGYAGMADQGDDDKSGYSDAFKRAGVKFGIARELYGDGVAKLDGWAKSVRIAPGTAPAPAAPEPDPPGTAVPAPTGATDTRFWDFLANEVETCNRLWQDEHGNAEEIVDWGDAVMRIVGVTHGARFHPHDPAEFTADPAEWIATLLKIASDPKTITVDGEIMTKAEWMVQHLQSWLSDQWQGAVRRRAGVAPAQAKGA